MVGSDKKAWSFHYEIVREAVQIFAFPKSKLLILASQTKTTAY